MLDDAKNPPTRTELLRLTPSGDLLDLAREMRQMGVESLLFCSPNGRIQQVVTDRQIASLAADPELSPVPDVAAPAAERPVTAAAEPVEPALPRQQAPVRANASVPVARP